jgi:hypothetical protein
MRRNQFTIDAESVQGIEGATATFRCLKVREMREWRDDPEQNDETLLRDHLVAWDGFVDDEGEPMPDVTVGELYLHEQRALTLLLFQGPDGPNAKN